MSQEGLKVKQKSPRILLELLVYGTEDNRPKIQSMLDEIQVQLNKARKNRNKVRLLWYIDKGEKSIDEKKEWLIENANCKYFVFTPEDNKVSKTYIRDLLQKIRLFENAFNSLKSSDIQLQKRFVTIKNDDEIPEAQIVE